MKQVLQEKLGGNSCAECVREVKRNLIGKSGIVGIVHVEKFNEKGEKVWEDFSHNLVTDVGDAWCGDRCQVTPDQAIMQYMEIGTSGTAPAKGNTILGAVVAGSRGLEDTNYPQQGTGADDNDIIHRRTFTGLTATGVQEVGIFNSASAGDMLDRSTFTSVNLTPSDSLQITVTITFLGA